MLKKFFDWLLALLGIGRVEHFDIEPVQSAPQWNLRDARQLSPGLCADLCGLPFKRPFGLAAEGFFWKRDRAGSLHRLYRVRV